MKRSLVCLLAGSLLLSGCHSVRSGSQEAAKNETQAPEDRTAADGPNQAFTDYTNDYVKEVSESSYLTMHQYFEHPEEYGIDPDKADITLGTVLPDEEDLELEDELEDELDTFRRQDLDSVQQVIYDQLKFEFETSDALYDQKYEYLDQMWNEYSNPASALVTTFSEYEIRDEEDLEPVVTLINDVPRYLDDCLAYTKTQADRGLLMMDYQSVAAKCDDILNSKADSAVRTNLHQEVQDLQLDRETEAAWTDRIDKALDESFFPQFERLKKDLKPYEDKSVVVTGLAGLPEGKDYYRALLRNATGVSDSPEEVRDQLEEAVSALSVSMDSMMRNNSPAVMKAMDLSTDFGSVDEIMEFLNASYARAFPGVKPMDFQLQPLSDEQSTGGTVAYFMIPPIDNTSAYRIRYNARDYGDDPTSITLYDTLAHEGIPGHMYQTQYDHEHFVYPIQYMLENDGFTEGYATYVEGQANKWLDADEDAVTFYNWNVMLSNFYIALMDLSVNYDGLSLEEFEEEYSDLFGDDLSGIYEQLAYCPTVFLSYYYGHCVIMEERNEARRALGSDFDDLKFNEALLKNGSVNFDIIRQSVDDYIASGKGQTV